MNLEPEALVYELSRPGRIGVNLPIADVDPAPLPLDFDLAEDGPDLPELDELTVVRHFTRLSQKNFSIDSHVYPLGSCTMKYNPKCHEKAASFSGWLESHPLAGEGNLQGSLCLIGELEAILNEIGGFAGGTLQAAAGAHGELGGLLAIRNAYQARGEIDRKVVLIPDSAHGTNPATATMVGFITQTIPSDTNGCIDMSALREACGNLGPRLAAIMITNPNTLGIFERNIVEICGLIHDQGAFVYGDGANMNALTGVFKPGAWGIDVMHYNLHKTFSTPHGGGGPGAAYLGASADLLPYLPGCRAVKTQGHWAMSWSGHGSLKAFWGNFSVLVRAYAYVRSLGAKGLRDMAEAAVLNANYLKKLLAPHFVIPFPGASLHEFVIRGDIGPQVHALDLAKALIDRGFHPPTMYFPLIVPEAFMIEPTETESKESLEAFAKALIDLAQLAQTDPGYFLGAPRSCPVGRLDETAAARSPQLCCHVLP